MGLRRGFKSEANWFAVNLRRELGLRSHDPICPWKLSEHLAICVVPLSDLQRSAPKAVSLLLQSGANIFSAVTIFIGRYGRKRLICNNDGNAKTRQAADIAHELAHALLGHPPQPLFAHDSAAEAEAKWMGPTLLVPDDAAHRIAKRGQSLEEAAEAYAVSTELMQYRLQVSGALIRARRSKK